MLKGDYFQQSNGLMICIDWLSFTVDMPSVPSVLSLLGYSMKDFSPLPKGSNGYRSQLKHSVYPLFILYDGNENMGIHVDISGSAISDVVSHYQKTHTSITPFGTDAFLTSSFHLSIFANLLGEVASYGNVTRLDLAIDDIGCQYFNMLELSSIFSSGSYSSKFRKWKELVKYQSGGERIGHTIYLGSRTSSIFLRIYDKQMEQNEKLLHNGTPPIMSPWIRWELELKGDRAVLACNKIKDGVSINEISIGILSHYLKIIQMDNGRKGRCSLSPKWLSFLDGVSSLSLYCPSEPKTIDDTKNWIKRQVAPSLASIVSYDGGSLEFVYDVLNSSLKRLTASQMDMIRKGMEFPA